MKRENKEYRNENKNDDAKDNGWVITTTTEDYSIIYDSEVISIAYRETSWVIANGTSIHATPWNHFS